MLVRIEAHRLLQESGLKYFMVATIHDNLIVDTPSKNVYTICRLLKQAVESAPNLCRKHFGYDFSLPLTCEVQIGPNKKDLKEYVFKD
jgi:DNA polymerase I-like protein with 3'-5' exonuclease and polymerase domains